LNRKGSWITLVGFCLMTVIGSALAFAVIVAGGSVALTGHQNSGEMQNHAPAAPGSGDVATFSGMVTDSYCGARHTRYPNLGPTECARTCIRKGAGYVLVNGDRRYILRGKEESLTKVAGTRAKITGTLEAETIRVSSASPLF
jgi:hypothetical protein